MCKLNVDSFVYTGMGNSTNKKDAQSNAARDFCQFLVRQGQMNADDIPGMTQTQVEYYILYLLTIYTIYASFCMENKKLIDCSDQALL